jgi:hypothetical protein
LCKSPGSIHDHITRPREIVQHANDLCLADPCLPAAGIHAIDFPFPFRFLARDAFAIRTGGLPAVHERQPFLEDRLRVADERKRLVLAGVELADVHGDELDVGMLKGRFRRRREVAEARSDDDNEVRFAGKPVGARGAGDTNRAERLRVIEAQRPFSGHRLDDRDAGFRGEAREHLCGLAVDRSAAGNDDRAPGGAEQRRGPPEERLVRAWTRDRPHALLEERVGIVVRLGLDVLRQAQRDGPRLGG